MMNKKEPKKWSDVKATDTIEHTPFQIAPLIVPTRKFDLSKSISRYAFVEQTRRGVKIVAASDDIKDLIEKVTSRFKTSEEE